MYLLLDGNQICDALNVILQIPHGSATHSVVEFPGDAETYDWPNKARQRCLLQNGVIVANPAYQPLLDLARPPTLDDLIAVLPAPIKAALDARVAAKAGK